MENDLAEVLIELDVEKLNRIEENVGQLSGNLLFVCSDNDYAVLLIT